MWESMASTSLPCGCSSLVTVETGGQVWNSTIILLARTPGRQPLQPKRLNAIAGELTSCHESHFVVVSLPHSRVPKIWWRQRRRWIYWYLTRYDLWRIMPLLGKTTEVDHRVYMRLINRRKQRFLSRWSGQKLRLQSTLLRLSDLGKQSCDCVCAKDATHCCYSTLRILILVYSMHSIE